MEKTNKKQTGFQGESLWQSSLWGALAGIGVILISALILPLIILNTPNPNGLVLPTAIICAALGSIAGGIVAARKSKGAEIISGIITAITILLPLIVISFIYQKGFSLTGFGIIAAVVVGASLIASSLTAKTRASKKQSMKKLMKKPR